MTRIMWIYDSKYGPHESNYGDLWFETVGLWLDRPGHCSEIPDLWIERPGHCSEIPDLWIERPGHCSEIPDLRFDLPGH